MSALWASAYAERLGWRVLPCWPGTKRALFPHTAASNDPGQIEAWVREHGDNLGWAVAAGPGSGLLILDVEDGDGERELASLEREHGPLPDCYPLAWSGGGAGFHAYFRWPGGEVRNRRWNRLEIRGDKLLCVLPPSSHPSGGRYRWADDRSPVIGLPDLPEAWVEMLKPEPLPEPKPFVPASDGSRSRYVAKAFEIELLRVAQAPRGTRNHTLNTAAHALFRFAAAGELDPDLARRGLIDAARYAGLAQHEALATIRSASRARGMAL